MFSHLSQILICAKGAAANAQAGMPAEHMRHIKRARQGAQFENTDFSNPQRMLL
jgi:hypothetical protein